MIRLPLYDALKNAAKRQDNIVELDFEYAQRLEAALRAAEQMRTCISLDIDAHANPVAYDLDSGRMLDAVKAFDAAVKGEE
jgi:hypothetical protein